MLGVSFSVFRAFVASILLQICPHFRSLDPCLLKMLDARSHLLFEVNTENVTFQLFMFTYARQKVPYFLTVAIVFFVCNPKQTFSDSLTYKTQDALSGFAIHVQAITCYVICMTAP